MKQVLIVSPHFPPINAPDMQRVRLALPHLRAHGWDPTVLAIAPESIEGGVREPLLEQTYPPDIRVVRVRGIPPTLTRWAGIGNLWWRCGGALTRAGDRLLQEQRFDLAFFSTTQFSAFRLGPRWRAGFRLPFILDYQDPWVNEYYARTRTAPPGGGLRFAFAQWRARRDEPRVLREAAGVVAVSDGYAQQLAQRYDWFDPAQVRVLPFGASARDFELARTHAPAEPLIYFDDGNIHHVYAGRAGPDMELALTILFRAFRRFLATDEGVARKMRFHFIGTGYAPPPLGRNAVRPIAIAEGVGDFVHEERHRVPYFDALHYLQRADALVAVGSDDPSYSASKLFPYILARRPLLLVYHGGSPVLSFAQQVAAGARFSFEVKGDIDAVADEVQQRWFAAAAYRRYHPFNEEAFAPLMAPALAAQLAAVFDAAYAKTA
jgi:hypothetical protein